jgi:Glycosyltransferase family 28 C-terminal domain
VTQPIGYFVHHQGRGHALRCAAIAHALSPGRPIRIFCARADIFPELPPHASVEVIESLFELQGDEPSGPAHLDTPQTLHCAPVGWGGIRRSMGTLAGWFAQQNPALMICDVSAEIAQLCRICSVPHVCVIQHGDRSDQGHVAAYDGAAGLLAPFSRSLAQPEWSVARNARTCFAGGIGWRNTAIGREAARARIGIAPDEEVIVVMSGGGGSGFASASLGVGARTAISARWISIGAVQRDWHATEPPNLEHRGWVDNPLDYIEAADLVVSSTGNTTCEQVLGIGRPWIAVPEWRYFDEQHCKAAALERAGLAACAPHLPSSAHRWRALIEQAYTTHDAERQRAMLDPDAARTVSSWIETLIARLWSGDRHDAIDRKRHDA